MPQGFDPNKPAYLDALTSAPMRLNFNALATCHKGSTGPENPEAGWLWLDTSDATNYKLRMYLFGAWVIILNNLMGGFPTQSGASKVLHTQAIAAASWTVTHALNTANVVVQIFDDSTPPVLIIPDSIEITDANTVTVGFLVATAGKAIVLG